jgi:hypothetical protein
MNLPDENQPEAFRRRSVNCIHSFSHKGRGKNLFFTLFTTRAKMAMLSPFFRDYQEDY